MKLTADDKPYTADVEHGTPLLWVIRDELKVKGSKYGCGIAKCATCTVHLDSGAVRSCQITAEDVEGKQIITIQGLGQPDNLHAAQMRGTPAKLANSREEDVMHDLPRQIATARVGTGAGR